MEKRKKYIAYGSNLNLEQMARRCPTAKVIGAGEIRDHELLFRGYRESAVATVEPKKGASVPVLIWEIGPEDERNLDIYEGHPRLYGKVNLEVQMENGSESIMAYTMKSESHRYIIWKPSQPDIWRQALMSTVCWRVYPIVRNWQKENLFVREWRRTHGTSNCCNDCQSCHRSGYQ